MTPEQWAKLQSLFERGERLSPEERRELLDQECAGDESLRAHLIRLWDTATRSEITQGRPETVEEPLLGVGERLSDRFLVEELIARGGMGEVYRAQDQHLGRHVVLKAIRSDLVDVVELRERLENEARAASALSHPRICALYDLLFHKESPVIVLEYLEGETLSARLRRGRIPTGELIQIAVQAAEGLSFAHRHGVLHRDLKPSNIMLTAAGVKLLDFGVAKRFRPSSTGDNSATASFSKTRGMLLGTLAYMSPEQAEGKTLDERSDIFSFGATLYEMATGERAFQRDTEISTLAAILKADPEPIRQRNPVVPPELEAIVRRCLEKDRHRRYQNVDELLAAVRRLSRKLEARSRRMVLAIAAGAAAVLVVLVSAAVIRRESPPPAPASGREEPLTSLHLNRITRGDLAIDPALSRD